MRNLIWAHQVKNWEAKRDAGGVRELAEETCIEVPEAERAYVRNRGAQEGWRLLLGRAWETSLERQAEGKL